MAWSSPRTFAAGEVLTAANLNTYVSDDLSYLYGVRWGNGRRNVLINSTQIDVWQRGTTFAVGSSTKTYTADRWAAYRSGATGMTVSRQTGPTGWRYTMRVQRDSGNSSTADLQMIQALETADSYKLAGQTCQLKVNLRAGANYSPTSSLVTVKVTYGTGTDQDPTASWTGTTDALSQTQAITTTATDYTFDSISIPSSATQVKVQISFTPTGTASTNDYLDITAVQLTTGQAPGYERIPAQETLALCQRYFYLLPQSGADGAAYSTTGCCLTCHFPVDMRTTPTSSYPAGTYDTNFWAIGNGTSTTVPTDNFIGTRKVTMAQDGYTGLTANRGGSLYSHPGISFSAEL